MTEYMLVGHVRIAVKCRLIPMIREMDIHHIKKLVMEYKVEIRSLVIFIITLVNLDKMNMIKTTNIARV